MTRDEFNMLKDSIERAMDIKKDALKDTVKDLTAKMKAVEGKTNPFGDDAEMYRHVIELQKCEVESYTDGVEFVLKMFEKFAIEGE